MKKRKNSRYTKRTQAIDPYLNLTADIIIDAILIATGQKNGISQTEAARWLRSEQCQRWAGVIGVNIEAALFHKDSLVRLEKPIKMEKRTKRTRNLNQTTFCLRLPNHLHLRLKAQARQKRRSMNQIITIAIEMLLKLEEDKGIHAKE